MVNQVFKEGDIVAIKGFVDWENEGKLKIRLVNHQTAYVECDDVTVVARKFEIGDDVISDTGVPYTIAAIYRDFAWVFSEVEGFDTVELSTLTRPDPEAASSDNEEAE